MRVAGIMSGTSLDGIDIAVVDIHKARLKVVTHRTTPYPPEVREAILAVSNTTAATAAISRLNFQLGELYAKSLRGLKGVELIGCHGQTIYHEGAKPVNSLQIGEAAVIAERTGIPVVSNFRARDIAAGGQGAPLVPFADYLLFRHKKRSRVVLNIGGIANFTYIPAGAKEEQVIAFDTGPGNMVMDALTAGLTGGKQAFDANGEIAAKAHVNRELLDELLRDAYYARKPPKSAGREQYGREFIKRLKASGVAIPDLIATATALTAATIAMGVNRFAPGAEELIVSGGGAHNRQLVGNLQALLPDLQFSDTGEHGIDGDAKEAVAFAVLAHRTWHGKTGNLPSATGARRAVVLGTITR
jgi:anhydro-N-acetylmuramic acid kinase